MKKTDQVKQLNFESMDFTRSEDRVSSSLGDIVKTAQEIAEKNPGIKIERFFTTPGLHPYDEVEWERRNASILNDKGKVVFEHNDVEVPSSWSQTALNVVASKYFYTRVDTEFQENSVRQLITRVVETITEWGKKDGYFISDEDAQIYSEELTHLLVFQKASYNSPVWFNVGVEKKPQCSACFINSVEDTMESILDLAKTEGLLFKWGSGTGSNLSPLRSSREQLSTGGYASGPVSFMKGYDAFAGVIKSGGKTRRAAKMVILNIDHPDIVEFINCKAAEEKKAWALIDAGYDGSFGGEAYSSVFFQNSNNSVRVTDEFMRAVESEREWYTLYQHGEPADTYRARDLMHMIADAAHFCGDPGIQFDSTINNWHTCPNSSRINASNPCSEFMFVDNSSCNLASLNLLKFQENGIFNSEAFCHAIHLIIISQEIIVDNASYPNDKIENNSSRFRPLGLGYANLGALLMSRGIPYDSEEGQAVASALTGIMTGQAYMTSAILASVMGPFAEFQKNREPMLAVVDKHIDAIGNIDSDLVPDNIFEKTVDVWRDARELGAEYGFRNSQVTVLAPTGTIGFMMDCDTTGIEPDIALVKYKKLVDGGLVKLVNNTVPKALAKLSYNENEIEEIKEYIKTNDTIEGAPFLKEEHSPVFDCAFKPTNGERFIQHMGHVKMMAAVQPFLSGAISKTVNMPNESTPEDIIDTYISAWKMGLKSIAIYRDGSKRIQPLSTSLEDTDIKSKDKPKPVRRRLPDERKAITHKFSVQGHEGYLTIGMYEDGTPGEIFVVMAKEGSVVSGLMDSFATAVSMNLQYGVPLKVLVNKFSHTRFEPSGFTNNPEIPIAKSISDYIFRWIGLKFLPKDEQPMESNMDEDVDEYGMKSGYSEPESKQEHYATVPQIDAPPCSMCGAIMVRSGSCYKCANCGATSGCS